MSRELQYEVHIIPEADLVKPSLEEIALINSILPELLRLILQIDESTED